MHPESFRWPIILHSPLTWRKVLLFGQYLDYLIQLNECENGPEVISRSYFDRWVLDEGNGTLSA